MIEVADMKILPSKKVPNKRVPIAPKTNPKKPPRINPMPDKGGAIGPVINPTKPGSIADSLTPPPGTNPTKILPGDDGSHAIVNGGISVLEETPTTPAFPELNPGELMTPEQMRQYAEALYNPAYQQALDALTAQEGSLGTQRDRMREDTNKNVTDEMIKRGLGRSTVYSDRLVQGLADVEQDYLSALEGINTQRSTLGATKEQNVNAQMLALMQMNEQIRQFNEDLALRKKAMRGGGGGSTGLSPTDLAAILDAYGSGDTGGSSNAIKYPGAPSWLNPATGKADPNNPYSPTYKPSSTSSSVAAARKKATNTAGR